MFYLMIVEDELKLQNNLAYNMGWEDHGIEVVGAAASGEEALLLIPMRKPDIMIVDIEMQGMDGLQLMEAVREIDPDIRFIVLSGHDDFEYVQKALRSNADNYLLKPAGNPEVVAAVLESTERIKAERAQKYGVELLQRRWREHLPALQKSFLQRWVKGAATESDMEKAAEEFMLAPLSDPDRLYLVAVVDMDPVADAPSALAPAETRAERDTGRESEREREGEWKREREREREGERKRETETERSGRDSQWLQSSLHSLVAAYFEGTGCFLFIDDNGATVAVFPDSGEEEEQWLYRINMSIVKLQGVILDCLNATASAGIGRPAKRGGVHVSYRQAKSALLERYMYGHNLVIPFTNADSAPREEALLPDAELERRLLLALESGDAVKAQQLVMQWFKSCCGHVASVSLLVDPVLFMHSLLTRYIHAQGWSVREVAAEELAAIRDPEELARKEHLGEWAGRAIDKILAYADKQRVSKRHRFIDELMAIVEESMDQDIGLHEIADRLFVSPSYLSRLFKKETKMTFSAYIHEKKMQKAKELLQEGAKVYEASRRTGYRDISYFTRLFRKYWGVMPSEVSRSRSADENGTA